MAAKNQLEFQFHDPGAPVGPPPPPGDFIRAELEKRGWSQTDLARILSRPLPTVNEIIQGKRAIMPEMAVSLGNAFGTGAEIWAHREAAYRLSLVDHSDADSMLRSQLFQIAPVGEMEKRGWITPQRSALDLKDELQRFFSVSEVLDSPLSLRAAARQTEQAEDFSPPQIAWLHQARRMAGLLNVRTFNKDTFKGALVELRKLAGSAESAKHVSRVLAEVGVRLVVVEALPKSRIDGAVFWLDTTSPVVVISLRFDRIDCFWFTLAHELAHIWNGDIASLDSDIVGENRVVSLNEIEARADREGAEWLIPTRELDSFVARNGPFFSAEKIHNFSKRLNVHPGIVTGQLQFRKQMDYKTHRGFLIKVRQLIVSGTMTDGWGIRSEIFI
jgi:HTH-type transcriptional regulator/antitoxin HigA